MTTIVYNGHLLVADSRRTSADDTFDDAGKIVTIEPGMTYEGENVLAFAACGRTDVISAMLKEFLKRGPQDFLDFYQEILRSGLPFQNHGTRFIFVTDKNGYGLQVDGRRVRYDKLLPDDWQTSEEKNFAVLGSGKTVTSAMIELFNMPVVLAVACAAISGKHNGTGGPITWITFKDGAIGSGRTTLFQSTQALMKEVNLHLRSDACHLLGGHRHLTIGSREPKTAKHKYVKIGPEPSSKDEVKAAPIEGETFFTDTLPAGVKVYKHTPSRIKEATLEFDRLQKEVVAPEETNRLYAYMRDIALDFSSGRAVEIKKGEGPVRYAPADFTLKLVAFIRKELRKGGKKRGGK